MNRDAALFNRGVAPVRVARLEKILTSKRIADREKDREFFKHYRVLIDDALAAARLSLTRSAAVFSGVKAARLPTTKRNRIKRSRSKRPLR